MRRYWTIVGGVVCAALFHSIAAAGDDWERSRDWYIEIKRAAKYARIAITGTGDLARIDAEEAAAKRQFAIAFRLPLPDKERNTCAHAAKAVVDFIAAAKAGNMDSGPASFERQKERWDVLSSECLVGIQVLGRGG